MREFSKKYKLSQREQDVLKLMTRKVVNAGEIAQHLGISQNTVRIHVKNINSKVGAKSKSEILGAFICFLDLFYGLSSLKDGDILVKSKQGLVVTGEVS